MNSNPTTAATTAGAAAQLQEGINLLLSWWTVLRLLTQSKEEVSICHVDDMLYNFMDTLNTDIDGGSIEEISDKLMVMREECSEGNFGSISDLRETNTLNLSYV
ncbi:hypothetical protein ABFS82_12G046000 [Erythranthe guttata]|uniref:uncharacterized protein LOC105953536 n=1 Tax=Erythranthe guttata TaxID=4155 RepID=UPI00064D8B02|nr:PREDICTED: uncharacterized protein LOC105953536 [Erythranthe guttata]|eukprot:XP_012832663.1 PREDICTED: uncharacterized protein LOC105953536 [Erythranthe guttata]